MSDPNNQIKPFGYKLDQEPSIDRKPFESKLDQEPSIQRGTAKGSDQTGTATPRRDAQKEAQSMGIDTKGMSTREIKGAMTDKKEAQKELADFIKETIKDLPKNTPANANAGPATVSSRTTEDKPSSLTPSKHEGKRNVGVPIQFYTWVNGKVGRVMVLCQSEPSPLEP